VLNVGGETGNTAKTFTTGYNLFVQVHRAEHLGGGAKVYNPYLTVEFAGNTLSTPPAKETHTLAFDECFRLPVSMPVFSDSIIIRVWNKNSWSSDEVIVQGRLSFSLIRTHALQPKWFNFYGFSSDEVPDIASISASGERPEPNTYQGRILVSARAQKVMKEGDLYKPAAIKGLVQEEPASVPQTILCDIFEVSGCPGAEVYVHCAVGRTAKKVKPVKRHKDSETDDPSLPGIFRFGAGTQNEKGRMAPMDIVMPAAPEQQLDVVISIYADLGSIFEGTTFQRVGFARIKMKDITTWMGQASAPRWVSCKPMAHLSNSIEPGAVLCSLYKCTKVQGEREPCAVRVQKFQLRVYSCMARGLQTASGGIQPNAFVHAACAGENRKTQTQLVTTEPVWNECLNLPIRLQVSERDSKAFPEPCQITVYDDCGEQDGLFSKLKNAVVGENEDSDEEDPNKKKLAEMKQQEDNYTMLTRLGQEALEGARDHIGGLRGDIMAKKRLGAVSQGRRVIGRVQVLFKRISRPGDKNVSMRPQWLKIHGGLMGNTHTGDILLGFELLKAKHTALMPERDLNPPMRKCSLFASILGLRNVDPVNGGDLTKPKITLSVQAVGAQTVKQELAWKKVPNNPLNKDDINRKWVLNGKQGYEFCSVLHLEVPLPQELIWAPSLSFILQDDKTFVGEGTIPLAQYIPWADPHQMQHAVTSRDEFYDSEDEDREKDEGVYVSEDSDNGDDGPSVQYVTIKIEQEALGLTFNADDNIVFPPRVQKVQEKSKGARAGVKQGDWLIGLKLPTAEPEKSMVLWKAAEASKFLANCDKNRIRPLFLRFRRQLRNEVTVNVKGKEPLGFELEPKPQPPPVFRKDNTKSLLYTKQAIDPGWTLAAVNAIDTVGMHANDGRLRSLLQKRPCVLTFRAPGNVNIGSVVNERKLTEGKPVQLNGVPLQLLKQDAVAMSKKLGQIRFMRVPKPTPILPNPADLKRLNLHPARAAILDVRGFIKPLMGGLGEDDGGADEEADHARPSVNGKLEEHFAQLGWRPYFDSVQLTNGHVDVGTLKVRIFVIPTVNPSWPLSLPHTNLASKFYHPQKFRQWIKGETPAVFRVRTYVIRGLNVSGSNSGYGNPYLFFVYGQTPVKLPGHRQMGSTEPRFFRTEERDVKMPEQSALEVGCYDYKEGYEDELIGKSFVDLEDRWFSPQYQEMVRTGKVPIEYRPLETGNKGSLSKGSLEMWIDLIDASTAAEVALSPLRPPAPVEVEIRIVLWTCRDISLRLCYDEDTGEPREKIDLLAQCQIDCRAYNGSQPKSQETDVHHSSEGEGEFNWRFVFSKISVTKGVPLDCFLQFIIFEHFSFSRPQILCETLLEMKNYCKRVSMTGEAIQLEAELPLENQKLKQQLKQDREGGGVDVDLDGDEDDYEEDDEGQYDEEAMNYGDAEEAIPPAGYVKVLVEVLTQAEASSPELKVGLGRNEPNRHPVVTFPKTGRSWQSVLPTALMVVETIMEAYAGGTKKCRVVGCFVIVILIIAGVHYVPGEGGCPIVQKSCKKQCGCCSSCYLDPPGTKVEDSALCYYPIPGYPDKCAEATWRDVCNCKEGYGCGDSCCHRVTTASTLNAAICPPKRRLSDGSGWVTEWLPQNGSTPLSGSVSLILGLAFT